MELLGDGVQVHQLALLPLEQQGERGLGTAARGGPVGGDVEAEYLGPILPPTRLEGGSDGSSPCHVKLGKERTYLGLQMPGKTREEQFRLMLEREVFPASLIAFAPTAPAMSDDRPYNEYFFLRYYLGNSR